MINAKNQLNLLMKSLEKFQICPGISAENYLDQLLESNNTPVYKMGTVEYSWKQY